LGFCLCGGLVDLFACSAFVRLCACGVGLFLIWFACAALFCLCACGVGLSLICQWSISVRPCAGQALTFFAAAKKVSKESGSNR
jgi:hypothetical protein